MICLNISCFVLFCFVLSASCFLFEYLSLVFSDFVCFFNKLALICTVLDRFNHFILNYEFFNSNTFI